LNNDIEKILNQTILIIIENAIGILVERKIKEPKVYISTYKHNNSIQIAIGDNAGGIKKSDLNKIFTLHYTNKKEKGLGIGLSLAKNLITNKLDGKIFVNNTKIGAEFIINLRLIK
jgi:C4-dicarboxylate-specific signal transduction histidine kinase